MELSISGILKFLRQEKPKAGYRQMKFEEGRNAVITQDGLIKVEFNAKGIVVRVNDKNIVVNQAGEISTDSCPQIDSLAQKAFQVGDRLRDGTVCIAVDLHKNTALFAPAGIIGGKAKFDNQGEIPAQFNKQNAYSYNDWRNITDDEGKTLSEVWDKVAPDELKGDAAPWFWLASLDDICDNEGQKQGHVRRGGGSDWHYTWRGSPNPVPVVRTGPARTWIIE